MTQGQHSTQTIRAALGHVSPDIPREEWVRVAMALKSELGEAGFELFDEWSKGGATYEAKAARSAWKSVKAGGGVTIGTLFDLAKAGGFQFEAPAARPKQKAASDKKQLAQAAEVREQAERDQREVAAQEGARKALERWDAASEQGTSAYLDRKACAAHGVRFDAAGMVLVPLRNADGDLRNVQRIAADGKKLFEKGAEVSGLWHWIGDPAGADAAVIAEGYATACSLFEAGGYPVAVAFNAGNLAKVAVKLRQLHPALPIVVAADNDAATEAKTGRNPGLEAATAAAKRCKGAMIRPEGLRDGGTDFNDLVVQSGRETVASTVADGVQRAQAAISAPARGKVRGGDDPGSDRFECSESGVWYQHRDREGVLKPIWICSPLAVEALTENETNDGKGYLLAFDDQRGRAKRWAMPARMLGGEGAEYRATLLDMGLRIGVSPQVRAQLAAYIQTRPVQTFARCVERVGWHSGGVYVWPERSFGDDEERVIFQSEERIRSPFRTRGLLDDWRREVATPCAGNSRLVFSVSAAFAGPCLALAGMEGGGFHLRGPSSAGKTTALRVASSVYGDAKYMQSWRNTANALEKVAEHFCDALLPLDEIGQLDPREVGDAAYMLANGQAKGRLSRGAAMRPRSTWRVLFLSTGETAIGDMLNEAKKTVRAGHEVRLIDIPSDAGKSLGVFEELHGVANGATFAERLGKATARFHGAPGEAFVEHIVGDRADVAVHLRSEIERLRDAWTATAADSGQVRRVAARFALVAAAGELATKKGITGWAKGEAERAAKTIFDAWCAQRGGRGDAEETAVMRQVVAVLQERGEANFPWWHRAHEDRRPNAPNRWGYRKAMTKTGEPVEASSDYFDRIGGDPDGPRDETVQSAEFYILSEMFRREVCKGFDAAYVARVLKSRGHLVPGESGRADRKERMPAIGLTRCFRVKPSIFEDDLL